MKRLALTTALAVLLPLCSQAADLTLDVEGLDTGRLQGATLMVAVFTDAAGWLRQPRAGQRFELGPEAAGGRISVVLKDLPDGPIALTLFQDVNANGRLDMSATGMPTEPYGFSNNASAAYGPPRFEQAQLQPAPGASIRVRLN